MSDFEDYLALCLSREPMSIFDKKEMGELLGNKSFQKVIAQIHRETEDAMRQVARQSLVSQDGIGRALNAQGRIAGLERALDIIYSSIIEEEEENEDA